MDTTQGTARKSRKRGPQGAEHASLHGHASTHSPQAEPHPEKRVLQTCQGLTSFAPEHGDQGSLGDTEAPRASLRV